MKTEPVVKFYVNGKFKTQSTNVVRANLIASAIRQTANYIGHKRTEKGRTITKMFYESK